MEKEGYDREEERWDGGACGDELDQNDKHQIKDKKKSGREEEKDHRSRDRERDHSKRSSDEVLKEKEKEFLEKDRVSTRGRRKDDRDEHGKDRFRDNKVSEKEKDHDRDKHREKEHEREREKDRKDRGKEKDRERERESEKERGKDKGRDRDREKERDKAKERDKEREGEKDREREKGKERGKLKKREADLEKERSRDGDNSFKINHEEDYGGSKDGELALDNDEYREKDEGELNAGSNAGVVQASSSDLEERIVRMKQERLKKKSEDVSEVSAWVSKSRKLEEKRNAEKEKALQLSKIFEEQDSFVQGESGDEEADHYTTHDLAGVKVLHGLDKVMDGGAVVLTLKDQSILANGDINEDVDMLENVEIGEQKRRDEAYKAAKNKTGVYDDKFNDEHGSEKKILPQYDDPIAEEGVTLDASGRFTGEAEKKLEELRKRLQGVPTNNRVEDLNNAGKISSDYYTQEEMLQFKKPKKKKALRKKAKLDIDALEAEAISAGLGGAGDLGSRNDARRLANREEEARSEAEKRNNAYQSAYAKAEEASKSLRLEQTLIVKPEEDENQVFADDEEDLYKSLERARQLALKKQEKSGPQGIALLATTAASNQTADDQNTSTGEAQENKVVITEMEEFVWGLQLVEEAHKPDGDDVFMDEDEVPVPAASEQDRKPAEKEVGGWTEIGDISTDEKPADEAKDEIVPDETIHEVAVGKGLSGALKLLKDRGTLKESIEWGGRNMDKKKSKLVGIVDDGRGSDRFKDIRIERTDEFGRIMTPKEAFRMLSHKFHGKGPGKMKQEKRMRQYQEELKLKQMKNSDTPSLSVERMREAQAQLKTPYLVLSGHVKPGQTSDPTSGFATVEKDFPGGLTPMLGDRKVEHFLGIKRKAEPGNVNTPKKSKA